MAASREFGIELLRPENVWGIYFPPSDWEEPGAWEDEESAVSVPPLAPPLHAPTEPKNSGMAVLTASPASVPPPGAALSCLEILAKGIEVFVRGMSASRSPFQEKTMLHPLNEQEATILITPVVDVGVLVQLIFPVVERAVKARTSGVGRYRSDGRWKMWMKFIDRVRLVSS